MTPPAAPGYVPASDSCWTGGLGASYAARAASTSACRRPRRPRPRTTAGCSCNPDGNGVGAAGPGPADADLVGVAAAVPGNPPVVRAEIEIPNPEGAPYGDAYWVKIYKTEADHPIELDELLLDDPQIGGAETEIEWELLQDKPGQGLVFNEAELGAGADAVMRRYEFYRYDTAWGRTHAYVDPETGRRRRTSIRRTGKSSSAWSTAATTRRPTSSAATSAARSPASTCHRRVQRRRRPRRRRTRRLPADPGCASANT